MVRYRHRQIVNLLYSKADLLLIGALAIFSFSLTTFFSSTGSSTPKSQSAILNLPERSIAIWQAKENGETTYNFETSFTPGLGITSSAMLPGGAKEGEVTGLENQQTAP